LDLTNDNNQKWIFIRQQDGTYLLKNLASTLFLEMNDRDIVTGHFRGDDSQKWAVIPQNDGTFMVQNIAYSDVLDSNHPGDVYRHYLHGGRHQQWFFLPASSAPSDGSIVVLTNKATNRALGMNSKKHLFTKKYHGNNDNNQKWIFQKQENGAYILKNLATSNVLTFTFHNTSSQRFLPIQQKDGSYVLESYGHSRVLDSNHIGHVYHNPHYGNNYQRWFFHIPAIKPYHELLVTLRNLQTNRVLDSNENNTTRTSIYTGADSQTWKFSVVDDKYYILENIDTSMVLQCEKDRIYLNAWANDNSQKWEVFQQDDDSYMLQNVAISRTVLDSNYEGAVYPHSRHGGTFQRWFLEPIADH